MPQTNESANPITQLLDHLKSRSTFTRNVVSTLASEVAGALISGIALVAFNKFFPQKAKQAHLWVEEKIAKPHIDRIEKWIEETGDFHPLDEELGKLTPQEKKAKLISKLGFEMAATTPVSFGSAFLVHRAFDRRLGLSGNDNKMYGAAYVAEGITHVAGLGLVNKTFAHALQKPKEILSKVLQRCGMSKESADTGVNYLVNLELPNITAAGVKLVVMELMSGRAAHR